MAIYNYDKITERDMDMLIMDEFCSNQTCANLFLTKIGLENAVVIEAYHSLTDISFGESDITFIVLKNGKRSAILIENKITAMAMEMQAERYHRRGEKIVQAGKAEAYSVFITAPQKYLSINEEAQYYPNRVAYESLLEIYAEKRDEHSLNCYAIIDKALDEQRQGYTPVEHVAVTEFWQEYYAFKRKYYPHLLLNEVSGPRGENASWPDFRTNGRKLRVVHKSDRGFIDLQLPNMGGQTKEVRNLLADHLDNDMTVEKANRSAAIRISVRPIDFKKPFSDYDVDMHQCLQAIDRLSRLAEKIDSQDLLINIT